MLRHPNGCISGSESRPAAIATGMRQRETHLLLRVSHRDPLSLHHLKIYLLCDESESCGKKYISEILTAVRAKVTIHEAHTAQDKAVSLNHNYITSQW